MLKSNGSGIKVWILEAVVGLVVFILLGVGSWWMANASDTLKTVTTRPDVEKMITSEMAPDRVKMENVQDGINELKQEFKEFRTKQELEFQKFQENQQKMMEILLEVKGKVR